MKSVLFAFAVICAFALCSADIPVHCVRSQTKGTWVFYLGPNNNDNSVDCSNFNEKSAVQEVAVILQDPDLSHVAALPFPPTLQLEAVVMAYFGFFKYIPINDTYAESVCSETTPGWYHNSDETHWGCFTAHHIAFERDQPAVVSTAAEPSLSETKYQVDYDLVKYINSVQSSWIAEAYTDLDGWTVEEVLRHSGRRSSLNKHIPNEKLSQSVEAEVYSTPVEGLPESFDWRNVNGVNYVSPVRNQQKCGSCYAFATCGLLEARTRILTNNTDQVVLSPQNIVSCSHYTQGCNGGFEYLVGKFGEDFGIAEESCFPYTATEVACSQACTDKSKYRRATNYRFVGGYYGVCNEALMMQEIYHNGPVTVEFMAYPDLKQYKSGIYYHIPQTNEIAINPWEEVNHAVLVVGWGVENGQKYWIVKNSWGTSWGIDGYFWIRRGVNECSIETMAVGITPVIEK